MMAGTIITVAPTGAEADKDSNPFLPTTPEEIAATASSCEAEGAAIIHVHARDQFGKSTFDVSRIRDTMAAIRESAHVVTQISTGGAVSDNESSRIAALDVNPEMASLTCGSLISVMRSSSIVGHSYVELYREMRDRKIVPEFELFN